MSDDGDIADLPRLDCHAVSSSVRRGLRRGWYRSALERGSGSRARETGLQTQDRLGVELRNARLRDAQDFPDLAEGELLVVVERHHELLALRQPGDRLANRLLHL